MQSSPFLRVLPLALILSFAAGCGHQPDSAVQADIDFADQPDLFSQPIQGAVADTLAPVATVDGTPITRAELQRETQLIALNLRQRLNPEQFKDVSPRIRQEALQGIIIRRLLADAVETENVEVSEAQVQEKLDEMRANVTQTREWSDFLAGAKMTEDQLREYLASRLKVETLVQSRIKDVPTPNDEEIRAYYDEHADQFNRPESVQLRHLFIKVDADADPTAWDQAAEKANALYRKIAEQGGDFDTLVAENSDDDTTRARGGFLGTFPRGKILPELETAAFDASVGEVTRPVRTKLGYHLLRVDAREPARQLSFDESRDWIANRLQQQMNQEAFQTYLRGLVDAADVVILSDNQPE